MAIGRYVVAITGSTLTSRAAAADSSGNVLAAQRVPFGLNILETMKQNFLATLHRLFNEMDGEVERRHGSKLDASRCDCVLLAVEGSHSERQKGQIRDCINSTNWAGRNFVLVDRGQAALLAGLLAPQGVLIDPRGVLVKVGTAAFVYGVSGTRTVRVGGWGPYTGDDGGAYSIGCNALHKVFRMYDGRDAADPAFVDAFLETLGAASPLELLDWAQTARRENVRAQVSEIARFVTGFHQTTRNTTAEALLNLSVDRLLESFATVMHRLPSEPELPVVLDGSVIQNSPYIAHRFVERLRLAENHAPCYFSHYRPILGALVLALQSGVFRSVDQAVLNNLRSSVCQIQSHESDLLLSKFGFEVPVWMQVG